MATKRSVFGELKQAAIGQAVVLFGCVFVAWVLELVDQVVYGQSLDRFGIRPRDVDTVWSIFAAPLLHGGWLHLAANTGPFVVLGWLVLVRRALDFVVVSLVAIVVGGLGVWLFGSPSSIHIGASGLVFGYVGYLLARGYFERRALSVVIALGVAVVYGSVLWGVLPGQRGISWEGHLFGFLGGIAAARLLV